MGIMKNKLSALLMAASLLSMDTQQKGRKPPPFKLIKPPKRGHLFTYDDGFECYALNQKNADRKHLNHVKKHRL
jgi:hypothetical protein